MLLLSGPLRFVAVLFFFQIELVQLFSLLLRAGRLLLLLLLLLLALLLLLLLANDLVLASTELQ